MTRFNVEYTDTFGGDANYCWVNRDSFDMPAKSSRAAIMRKAKALMGLTGQRGNVSDMGDLIEFRPYRSCTVMFVSVEY